MHNFIDGMSNLKIYSIDDFEWDRVANLLIPKIDLTLNIVDNGDVHLVVHGKQRMVVFTRNKFTLDWEAIQEGQFKRNQSTTYAYSTRVILFNPEVIEFFYEQEKLNQGIPWSFYKTHAIKSTLPSVALLNR